MKRKTIYTLGALLSIIVMFIIIVAYEQNKIGGGTFWAISIINITIGCLSAKKAGLFYER